MQPFRFIISVFWCAAKSCQYKKKTTASISFYSKDVVILILVLETGYRLSFIWNRLPENTKCSILTSESILIFFPSYPTIIITVKLSGRLRRKSRVEHIWQLTDDGFWPQKKKWNIEKKKSGNRIPHKPGLSKNHIMSSWWNIFWNFDFRDLNLPGSAT